MRGRRPKSKDDTDGMVQPELGPGPQLPRAPIPAPPAPSILEFVAFPEKGEDARGIRSRIEKWDLFQAEFPQVNSRTVPEFQLWLRKSPRPWLIVRRLFGVMPFERSLDDDPDDFRPWGRAELCTALGIKEDELTAELEAVRVTWKARKAKAKAQEPKEEPKRRSEELLETDDDVLKRNGYPPTMFGSMEKEENRLEKAWFAKRVKQFEPLLTRSPMTQRLARQALNNELELHRHEAEVWELDARRRDLTPDQDEEAKGIEKRRETLRRKIAEVEDAYRDQLKAIEEHAPWFNVTGEEITQEQCIADFIRRYQEYDQDPANQLVDGVFTSTELQKMTQTSVQVPEPRYRAGWVTYINESKGWLHNPAAKARFKPRDLAKLDAGWKEAVHRFVEETDEPVPDLEQDGSEYEELYVPDENGMPVIRAEVKGFGNANVEVQAMELDE